MLSSSWTAAAVSHETKVVSGICATRFWNAVVNITVYIRREKKKWPTASLDVSRADFEPRGKTRPIHTCYILRVVRSYVCANNIILFNTVNIFIASKCQQLIWHGFCFDTRCYTRAHTPAGVRIPTYILCVLTLGPLCIRDTRVYYTRMPYSATNSGRCMIIILPDVIVGARAAESYKSIRTILLGFFFLPFSLFKGLASGVLFFLLLFFLDLRGGTTRLSARAFAIRVCLFYAKSRARAYTTGSYYLLYSVV